MSFVALALATIGVGLLIHLRGSALGPATRDILGDALWAMMMTFWIGALAPAARLAVRAAAACAICVIVETSQLLHAPWLDALRATGAGHLVLGSGFDPRDLLAYALGVALASALTAMLPFASPEPRAHARTR